MSDKPSFIIQARSASTRLPGKILLPFYNSDTILDIQLKQIQKYFPGATIIIATTINPADDVIEAEYAANKNIKIFRGDEDNVLKRFIDAAKHYNIQHIVRICSDNPFLSMPYIEKMISRYFETYPEYVSYRFKNGTPAIKAHAGLFAEMMSLGALNKIVQKMQEPLYTEHVTNYIYTHPDIFRIEFIPVPERVDEYFDKLRLTIDTQQDFENLQKLYLSVLSKYGESYTTEQVLDEVDKSASLVAAMQENIKKYAK